MEVQEYIELIKKTYEEVITNFKTSSDKKEFERIFLDTARNLIDTKDEDSKASFEAIASDYLKSVGAIAKLSPGLTTGLRDEEENITLNTYDGKMSNIPNDDITEETVFDASSMTTPTFNILLKEIQDINCRFQVMFLIYFKAINILKKMKKTSLH